MTDEIFTPEWLSWPQTRELIKAFADKPDCLRFVGGCVRDALLGREVSDVDAATTLLPEQTLVQLEKAGIKAIPTGLAHGTITAVIDKKQFEITTLRNDVTTDGRHAQVRYTDNWQEDAARRDFTMNALFLSPEGKLFDYTNGKEDARNGHVRFIGDAAMRINEDYLRILRYFRFFAHYGKQPMDGQALAACNSLAVNMQSLSGERIQQEMLKLFSAQKPYDTLAAMEASVLPVIFDFAVKTSDIKSLQAIEIEVGKKASALTKLAVLLTQKPQALGAISERWKLSNKAHDDIDVLLKNMLPADTAGQKKLLRRLGKEAFEQLALVSGAKNSTAPYAAALKLAATWNAPQFPLSGKDLLSLGIGQGPDMGALLKALEDAWETSDYTLGKDALLAMAKKQK